MVTFDPKWPVEALHWECIATSWIDALSYVWVLARLGILLGDPSSLTSILSDIQNGDRESNQYLKLTTPADVVRFQKYSSRPGEHRNIYEIEIKFAEASPHRPGTAFSARRCLWICPCCFRRTKGGICRLSCGRDMRCSSSCVPLMKSRVLSVVSLPAGSLAVGFSPKSTNRPVAVTEENRGKTYQHNGKLCWLRSSRICRQQTSTTIGLLDSWRLLSSERLKPRSPVATLPHGV